MKPRTIKADQNLTDYMLDPPEEREQDTDEDGNFIEDPEPDWEAIMENRREREAE